MACGGGNDPAACIQAIHAEDDRVGALRNQAPEDTTLAVAINGYVEGLDALDFSGCPEPFALAYGRHRDAWAEVEAAAAPHLEPAGD